MSWFGVPRFALGMPYVSIKMKANPLLQCRKIQKKTAEVISGFFSGPLTHLLAFQQRQDLLRTSVGLRQHGCRSLLQYLRTAHCSGFCGEIGISNT